MSDLTKKEKLEALYKEFGQRFPYATDTIAYYIFGDKSEDNVLIKSYKGAYGRGTVTDASTVSAFMLDMECSWRECIEEIDEFVKNLPTSNGNILSDYY